MGFLNKSTITVDAILTKKGRELLAAGTFDITKFAVADDDVDYNLWDINHAKGSNFYGQAIENMPLTEAVPDGGKMMRYKLMTLPKNVTTIPYGTTSPAGTTIDIAGGVQQVGTLGISLSNTTTGNWTATIANTNVAYFLDDNNQVTGTKVQSNPANTSISITMYGKSLLQAATTTITVVHDTGLTFQKTIAVARDPQYVDGQTAS